MQSIYMNICSYMLFEKLKPLYVVELSVHGRKHKSLWPTLFMNDRSQKCISMHQWIDFYEGSFVKIQFNESCICIPMNNRL